MEFILEILFSILLVPVAWVIATPFLLILKGEIVFTHDFLGGLVLT